MSRYADESNYNGNAAMRQKDLVLSTNEYCFLQNRTNGAIKTYTGPIMLTISQQENLVVFNTKTKRFEETADFEKARQLFTSAPEGWYVVLKNPSKDSIHPEPAKAVNSAELEIGRKINIPGPCSFSLYPGQMAKVVQGHRLRSNQYLLARVYDASAAEKEMETATIVDADGNEVNSKKEKYHVGQLLVIKGTEVSFYMPPTGIEVLSVGSKNGQGGNQYIRDAVTLERLEYAILKDEDGNKRYMHGPAVVFPNPTETFVETPKGGNIFRALELSPISGIYIKVIASYDEEKNGQKIHHPIGEELFITGNEQMIYYPRPEHAMIEYDGKYMHHAIAIPEGEGRYILDRLTGNIKTVKGPKMYLPDPRKEVVVKRKLTEKECCLIYPNNREVYDYNASLSEKAAEKAARKGITDNLSDVINMVYSTSNQEDTLAIFEANANISRGVSYTKPRTIVLDTKFDGVVSVNVFTGFAVNVVSKSGDRQIVVGPQTVLLDYDETLESMSLSTGKPKTTDYLEETVYLKTINNKISDIITAETKDFVTVRLKVSYCVDFLEDYKDHWFDIDNYVKYLCDRERSMLKKEIKKLSLNEFYDNASEIVSKVVLNIRDKKKEAESKPAPKGTLFKENGMFIKDIELLAVEVDSRVANILDAHQQEAVRREIELSNATRRMEVVTQLENFKKKEAELTHKREMYEIELESARETRERELAFQAAAKRREEEAAKQQAEADMQKILDAIQEAKLKRAREVDAVKIETEQKLAEIEAAKQKAYADTVTTIMASISDDLVAAMTSKSNAELLQEMAKSMSPYSIAQGESVVDTTTTLVRGTAMEEFIKTIEKTKKITN